MRNKIKTTEQDIVRDIIGYSFPKDNRERDSLIAKIVSFGLENMSQDYSVDGKKIKVQDDDGIKKRQYASICLPLSEVSISPKAFSSRKFFGEDLVSICHEVCHFAEHAGDVSTGARYTGNSSCINTMDLFKFSCSFIMATGEYSRFKNTECMSSVVGLNKAVSDYVYARYILDPFEVRARRFACDMVEKMIDIAHEDIGISTVREYLNLKQMQSDLCDRRDKDYINIIKANKVIAQQHSFFVDMVRSAREGLLRLGDDGKNAFDRILDIPSDYYIEHILNRGDIVRDSFVGLMIDYDDNMANTLVNTILRFDDRIYDKNLNKLIAICTRTDFVPNEQQINIMRARGNRKDWDIDQMIEDSRSKVVLHSEELEA